MIAGTTVRQPPQITTTVTSRGTSVAVGSAAGQIAVTQVSRGLTGDPGIFVSDTPPLNPYVNQLWLDTST